MSGLASVQAVEHLKRIAAAVGASASTEGCTLSVAAEKLLKAIADRFEELDFSQLEGEP